MSLNGDSNSMHFFNYQSASKSFNFGCVPYSKVKYLKITKDLPFHIEYKTSVSDETTTVSIRGHRTRTSTHYKDNAWPAVNRVGKHEGISLDKKKDLISMLKFMPEADKTYLIAACNLTPLMSKQ